jgi:hypothetical protein
MSVQEVIDLTTESPVQLAVNTLDPSANSSQDGRKLKRKKKSLNSKFSSTGTPDEVPSTPSDSNERSAKPPKRKRIDKTSGSNERCSQTHSGEPDKSDSADLFFVDLSPTVIPSIPVSQESSSATNGETKKVDKLLLPSHVTVFGNALVEIISQPLSDSDDDEFIKYLDYEDTRVCTHFLFVFLRVHSIVFLRMYHDTTMKYLIKQPPLIGLFAKIVEQKAITRLLLVLFRL